MDVLNEFGKQASLILKNYFPHYGDSLSQSGNLLTHNIGEYHIDLKESAYFFESDKLEFIHYTSIDNISSILNDGSFRLFDFKLKNDNKEFLFASEEIFQNQKFSSIYQYLFSLSLFENNNVAEAEEFRRWRYYGNEGKGIALVLEIDKANRVNWRNVFLSKIYYGKDSEELIQVKKLFNELELLKNKFSGYNVDFPSLIPLLAFHKSKIWKDENEIRLLLFKGDKWYERTENITKDGLLNSFVKINIDNKSHNVRYQDETLKDLSVPKITIKEIILGYKYDNQTLNELNVFLQHYYPAIQISLCKLKDEFF